MSDQVAIMARMSELEAVLTIGGTLLAVFVLCLLHDILSERHRIRHFGQTPSRPRRRVFAKTANGPKRPPAPF